MNRSTPQLRSDRNRPSRAGLALMLLAAVGLWLLPATGCRQTPAKGDSGQAAGSAVVSTDVAGSGAAAGAAGLREGSGSAQAGDVSGFSLKTKTMTEQSTTNQSADVAETVATAYFGAGCFWCVDAAFEMKDGVKAAVSGYMGGHVASPTYEQVCSGQTGHAEVVKVTYDPQVISYPELVDWFFQLHDPTTLNRQGADVGTQYRSAIFTVSQEQYRQALEAKAKAVANYADPIVTQIEQAGTFYPAEGYHQDFYRNNPSQPYCRMVITPKLRALEKKQ